MDNTGIRYVSFAVENEEHRGMRLDLYISKVLGLCSRSQLAYYSAEVSSKGKPVKLSKKIRPGEAYELAYSKPAEPAVVPEYIELDIVYEDEDVIVVNKPQGMVVHPGQGNFSGTLIQGLLHYCNNLQENFPEEQIRPGIVHRLDKDTSGVIITAKHKKAQEYLAAQFRRRKVKKLYYGIVKGRPPAAEGHIEKSIVRDKVHRKRFTVTGTDGKKAFTKYKVKKTLENYSLLLLSPKTGRTHQLRVHCAWMGTPILGDPVYSRKDNRYPEFGLMLHAYSLKIRLPGDGEVHVFRAPLPERFKRFLLLF